jgi:hypothetical protein
MSPQANSLFDPTMSVQCLSHPLKVVGLEVGARQIAPHRIERFREDRFEETTALAVVPLIVEPRQ